MRLALACAGLAIALAAMAMPVAADDPPISGPTPECAPIRDTDGTIGFGCGLRNMSCTQALWGYHSGFLTVGGNSGCHAMVAINPYADPEPRLLDDLSLLVDTDNVPVDCHRPNPRTVVCWIDNGDDDVGVACGTTATGVGFACSLLGVDCTQALWGIHTEDLVIGGYSGCNAGVWANPQTSW